MIFYARRMNIWKQIYLWQHTVYEKQLQKQFSNHLFTVKTRNQITFTGLLYLHKVHYTSVLPELTAKTLKTMVKLSVHVCVCIYLHVCVWMCVCVCVCICSQFRILPDDIYAVIPLVLLDQQSLACFYKLPTASQHLNITITGSEHW